VAGTVAVTPENRWSAAGWLFDWTLEFLAERVADPQLKDELHEIVAENLGWLGLGDYGSDAEQEMRALIRAHLVSEANQQFSPTMANRDGALRLLQDLADQV